MGVTVRAPACCRNRLAERGFLRNHLSFRKKRVIVLERLRIFSPFRSEVFAFAAQIRENWSSAPYPEIILATSTTRILHLHYCGSVTNVVFKRRPIFRPLALADRVERTRMVVFSS